MYLGQGFALLIVNPHALLLSNDNDNNSDDYDDNHVCTMIIITTYTIEDVPKLIDILNIVWKE